MVDNTYDNSINGGIPLPEFLKSDPNGTPAARKGKINRFGHFIVNVAKSKKTHDLLIGAAISGGTSMAVRAGVVTAAATVGAAAIPTAILAAAAAGAATGGVRYYLNYRKEKEAGTWEGFDFKKCAKKLLVSTAFSTVGGGMTYAFMHQEEAMKFAKPVIDMLREAGVIDAVSKTFETAKSSVAAAMNWSLPGSTDFIAKTSDKVVTSVGKVIAAVTNYDYGATYSSSVETVKETFKGWGASIKNALGFSAPEPKIVIAEPQKLPSITSAEILAQTKETVAVETPAPAAEAKPVVPLALEKGWTGEKPTLATAFDGVRFEEAFKQFDSLPKPAPDIMAYVPELGIYPKSAYELPPIPASALRFGTIYSPDISAEMTAAIETPAGDTAPLENVPRPVPRPVSFADRFAKTFEDMDLSRRADRAFEAALNGTDQQRKDLAMNVLNGQGGFKKDPELAASIYKFLLEDTKPAAGEKPSQTHLQVVRDTAYILFHGKGVAADPEAAKAMLQEIAPNSRVARGMLAEWNGETVREAASVSTRGTLAAARDTVTQGAGKGGLNCEFLSAGNRIVSGSCDFKGEVPLKVGDRITLTP